MGISKSAEEIGFKTFGGRFTFDQFVEIAPLPCIVLWQQSDFVVTYRIKKNKRRSIGYVADPGIGLTSYTQQ